MTSLCYKISLAGTCLILISCLSASSAGIDSLPAFRILLSNGKYFTNADLPKKKAVMLVYFAPDCEHCQKELKDIFGRIEAFMNTEILLVTFKPVSEMAEFERQYQTHKYPNIIVGTEGTTYYLRYYFKLANTPFTALYNKERQLVYAYKKPVPANELIKRLKTIK